MENIPEYSAIAIIVVFLIREMFAYLKSKKIEKTNGTDKAILSQLQLQNENHLMHITESIEKLTDTIRNGNEKMIALLSEIRGILNSK